MSSPFWIALCLLTLIGRPVAAERIAGDEGDAPEATEGAAEGAAGEEAVAPDSTEAVHRAAPDSTEAAERAVPDTSGTVEVLGSAARPVTIEIPDSMTSVEVRETDGGRFVVPTIEVRGERIDPADLRTQTTVSLGRSEVERFQPASVADALVTVPGVDLTKTGPWSTRPSLRGLGGQRVLLKVDGVRINPVRGHGPDPSIAGLDRIESIEVQPGASAAQNGTDALGGVINIVTRRPLLEGEVGEHVAIRGRASDPGGGRSVGASLWSTRPGFGFEVDASRGEFDALRTPDGEIANSGYRDESLSLRLAVGRPDLHSEIQASRYSAYDVGLPAFASTSGNAGVYPLRRRDALRFESVYETPATSTNVIERAAVIADAQRNRTHFTETTVDSSFVRGNFVARTVNDGRERVVTDDLGLAPELRLRLMAGVELYGELRRQSSDGPREDVSTVISRNGDTVSRETTNVASMPEASRDMAAVGVNAARYVERFRLNAGLRYDRVATESAAVPERDLEALETDESRVSGSFGVTRKVGFARLYARTATGFRVPALDERYYNGFIHGGLYLFGNTDLGPEKSWSNEIGVRMRSLWNDRIEFLRLSVYRSDVDDLITFRYVGQLFLVPRFQYVNVDRARLSGVELTGRVRMLDVGLEVSGSVPRGEDLDTGERIPTLGPRRLSLEVDWPVHRIHESLDLRTRLRWSDALSGIDDDLERPAFWTVAVELGVRVAGVRAALSVRNLFDHAYAEPLSSIPEPGRTVGLSLRYATDLPTTP
ncbi:MAG TPA: TonB-dependent receptor [Candidatus Krumholzibacteria bacterium]|nr:TonB-dependent receptor [Candidatus Krumholzibacteria bacterium]